MSIIKIPKAGDEVTIHVVKCEVVESQLKNKDGTPQEQVKFTAANGDVLFIGRETADRQLSRIGFADGEMVIYGDVDGTTIHFYRTPNKTPAFAAYWNLERVTDVAAPHQASNVKQPTTLGPSIPGLDEDDGYMESLVDDDGFPPQKQPAPIVKLPNVTVNVPVTEGREDVVNAAYARAYLHAVSVQGQHGTPDSLQAGCATLLIAYRI